MYRYIYTILGPRKFGLGYWTYVFDIIMICDQLNNVAVWVYKIRWQMDYTLNIII
jgi:hypothetical protein